MKKLFAALMATLFVVLLCVSATACAEETLYSLGTLLYRVEDGGVTIVSYVGEDEEIVVIPNRIGEYPVSKIAAGAFDYAEGVTVIYLPDTIMEIEPGAIPGNVAVVRDYNLYADVSVDPSTGAVDPATLPTPEQARGELVYQSEDKGVTIVDETYLYPKETVEEDETDAPKPHLRPRALPGATPVLGQYGAPWVWLRKTPLPKAALEPAAETIAETPAEPEAEPTTEPTVEPTTQPTAEPTPEPTAEPTVEPTAEPTVEPTAEPTVEPTTEPTGEAKGANTAVTAVVAALVLAAGGAAAWFAARRRKGSGA